MRKLCSTLLVFFLNLTAFSAPGAPTAGHEITVAAAADLNYGADGNRR
jgi:hypothetical protein